MRESERGKFGVAP